MSQTPVTCPKQPLSRDLDVEIFISRPQTELATDLTMIALLTPNVRFSDGGNDRVRFYNTLESLVNDVPLNSAAYWAGQAFFARALRPTTMCVGQVFTQPTPAVLRGGRVSLVNLAPVTNGGFDFTVNGDVKQLRGLDFSSASTLAAVAAVVAAQVPELQVTAANGSLTLKTNLSGDGAEISYPESPATVGNHISVLTGGPATDIVAALKPLTNASLTVEHDGNAYSVGGLDFSTVTTPADVANILQQAFRLSGFVGVNVHAGVTDVIFSVSGLITGTGFSTTVGGSLAPVLNLTMVANYINATTAVPASITSGIITDFAAVAALGSTTLKFIGNDYPVNYTGVTDIASLVVALNAGSSGAFTAAAGTPTGTIVITAPDFVTYVPDAPLKLTPALSTAYQPVEVPAQVLITTTDVSGFLGLTEALAASNVIGYTPGSLVSEAALVSTAARCSGQSIYGWILDAQYRDTPDQKAFADWCEARDPSIFIACTNSPQAYNSADSNNIGAYCFARGYKRTGTIYHNNPQVYPDMSYLACALSVNYAQRDSALTMKFKQLDGIEPAPLSNSNLAVLQSRNINTYVYIGNVSREVREGTQALATWFTDSLVNLDNFREEIQVEIYNVFLRSKKIPYTQAGQNMLVSAAAKICARYTRNGVFAPRDIETQSNETGFETLPATNIQPAPITGATASDRARRLAPPILVTAYEAGAFHKVALNVNVFN